MSERVHRVAQSGPDWPIWWRSTADLHRIPYWMTRLGGVVYELDQLSQRKCGWRLYRWNLATGLSEELHEETVDTTMLQTELLRVRDDLPTVLMEILL